ncbi:8674_t:CDS:2 [Dentiscutata erythropus]|uniref:8674_t:CDS:1 n=1 Tax=Dentiscutata erythropus TaxID=1348616 RepID=A0A9N9ITL3_9GLOM|nr:8674_t:CDS:2 [Dentiscutata erythropus]
MASVTNFIGNIYIDDPFLLDDNIEAESSHENSHINEYDNLETSDSSQAEAVVGDRSWWRGYQDEQNEQD